MCFLLLQNGLNTKSQAILSGNTLEANMVEGGTGKESLKGGAVTIQGNLICAMVGNNMFFGNLAPRCGGAVSVTKGSTLELEGGLFRNNQAHDGNGGAICIEVSSS